MPLNLAMSVMTGAEFVLWAVVGFFFWKKRLQRRFPAMGYYLALRVTSTPVLVAVLYAQSQPWGQDFFQVYFFGYWAVYIASAALLLFVCTEVFRSALSPFPGLAKLGLVIFRWMILASLIVSFSTISFEHRGVVLIPVLAFRLMRSVSILELCLLAFLCLSMNALRMSVRDAAFGIALGFGMMVSGDWVVASFFSHDNSLISSVQFGCESLTLLALGLWVAYAALPEPARKPIMVAASSTIYRWNEIASALGHTGTQVAVQPANSFFLTDVEKVVEKVLTRNLQGNESKS